MALTAQQLSDLRADLGDSATAFSDDELNRNYDRVSGATSEQQRHNATLALCFRQLLASAAKMHDYTAGAVGEKLSQVYDHVRQMYALYEPDLNAALGQNSALLRSVIKKTPHQTRIDPIDEALLPRPKRWTGPN